MTRVPGVFFFWISSNGRATFQTTLWRVWRDERRAENISRTQASAKHNGMHHKNIKRNVAEVASFLKRMRRRKKIANATYAITSQISVQNATAWMCPGRLWTRFRTRKYCNSLSCMWTFTILVRRQTTRGVSPSFLSLSSLSIIFFYWLIFFCRCAGTFRSGSRFRHSLKSVIIKNYWCTNASITVCENRTNICLTYMTAIDGSESRARCATGGTVVYLASCYINV